MSRSSASRVGNDELAGISQRPPLLTFEQARQRLNVGKSTLWNLLHSGELPARKVAGVWRIDPERLEAYIAGGSALAAAPQTNSVERAIDADNLLGPVQNPRFM